jgi:hypothetical protein
MATQRLFLSPQVGRRAYKIVVKSSTNQTTKAEFDVSRFVDESVAMSWKEKVFLKDWKRKIHEDNICAQGELNHAVKN